MMTPQDADRGQNMPSLLFMEKTLEVVLLEDHPLYGEGLKSYILTAIPRVNFSYIGANFLEAKQALEQKNVALAIVDLHLGDGRAPSEIVGVFTARKIPVLVISALNNFESVKSAFSMGATGFVTKDSPSDEILKAIQNVLGGKEWISPTLNKALRATDSPIEKLSAQELKASILYASGLKLDVVARRMNVAPSTVKQYIDRVKMKLRNSGVAVSTKTELYKVFRDAGLVD
jgi:DNA-binding NarL/FixJ family response regulator